MSFFTQQTAYEKRISDWRSHVCSSDLLGFGIRDCLQLEAGIAGAVADSATALHGDTAGLRLYLVRQGDAALEGAAHRSDLQLEICLIGIFAGLYHSGTARNTQCQQLGRASCRERVCPYAKISVVA